ncbi:MAG: hypothetical protein ACKVP0_20740 [Pirellulaceae bacterium]
MSHQEPTLPEIDPVEEELVAYLDEELAPDHRARVEHRLAEDARYREKLRHMQKSWDMLDLLARSEPDEGFTRTTVAMVALKAKEATDVQKESSQRFITLFRLAVAAATVACGLVAYSVGSWLLSAPDRQLVQDLPLIEHIGEYSHAESVAFLKLLDRHGLFVPDADDESVPASAPRTAETAEQRRDRLSKMTPEQKGAIAEKKQRFEALSPEEQERLRKLAMEIDQDAHADHLKQVLTNYHDWLKLLGSKDQTEVLSAAADQRIATIKEAQVRQATQRLKAVAVGLSSQDVNAISVWLEMYVTNHQKEFGQRLPAQFKAAMESLPEHERIARHVRGILWRLGRKELLPSPTDQELDMLLSVLSPKAQEVLQEADSHEQKWQYAQEFILQVQQSKRYPRLSDEELRKFVATLKPEQREALENKTADEMKNALRDLYYRQKASPPGGFYPWEASTFGPPTGGKSTGGKSTGGPSPGGPDSNGEPPGSKPGRK